MYRKRKRNCEITFLCENIPIVTFLIIFSLQAKMGREDSNYEFQVHNNILISYKFRDNFSYLKNKVK